MYLIEIGGYWDKRARGYSQTIHKQLASREYEYYRGVLRENAPAAGSLDCLDIGCGPGFFSILLAQDGHNVTAVDCSEGMLKQAKANFEEMAVSVKTALGDAQSLPFTDNSFDYIVSRDMVWNLEQPEAAYKEWLRILKPGGRMLVMDGNYYLFYYDEDYSFVRGHIREDIEHHDSFGVDPIPINEIARHLPLSKQRRPYWDMETLLKLGAERMNVDVDRSVYKDQKTGEERSVIQGFALCAQKP